MSKSEADTFSQIYDFAYNKIRYHTNENDNRKLNGAARDIAQYVINLMKDNEQSGGNNG